MCSYSRLLVLSWRPLVRLNDVSPRSWHDVQVLAIIQSITIHLAVDHGLGRHRLNLNAPNFAAYSKVKAIIRLALSNYLHSCLSLCWCIQAFYTSQILKIAVFYLAKLSVLVVFLRLTPVKRIRQIFWLFNIILSLWTVVAIITFAVQCAIPQSWNFASSRCLNQVGLGMLDLGFAKSITGGIVLQLWHHQYSNWSGDHFSTCTSFVGRSNQPKQEASSLFSVFNTFCVSSRQDPHGGVCCNITRVCISVALELASLREYFDHEDKPCRPTFSSPKSSTDR